MMSVKVYAVGARNFLFLNVPSIERAPVTLEYGASDQMLEGITIQEWNWRLVKVVQQLREKHADVTIFDLDTYTIFNAVLNNPKIFPQTAGYRNTTSYCEAYVNGTPNMTSFNPSCGLPVNEYFWLNPLHPTYPMHNAMAKQIANLLENVPPGGVGCNGSGSNNVHAHENGNNTKDKEGRRLGYVLSRMVKWKL
jgi:phospholipase/lecithinase/hemolysin